MQFLNVPVLLKTNKYHLPLRWLGVATVVMCLLAISGCDNNSQRNSSTGGSASDSGKIHSASEAVTPDFVANKEYREDFGDGTGWNITFHSDRTISGNSCNPPSPGGSGKLYFGISGSWEIRDECLIANTKFTNLLRGNEFSRNQMTFTRSRGRLVLDRSK